MSVRDDLNRLAMHIRFSFKPGIELEKKSRVSSKAHLDAGTGGSITVRSGARIHRGCEIRTYGGDIDLGEDCSVMPFVTLFGHGNLRVGARTIIAPHAVLVAANHRFEGRRPMTGQGSNVAPIEIGPDCWIAANAVITAGVRVGEGAVIGAGAIVITDVPKFAVVVGNPGRVVRVREESVSEV